MVEKFFECENHFAVGNNRSGEMSQLFSSSAKWRNSSRLWILSRRSSLWCSTDGFRTYSELWSCQFPRWIERERNEWCIGYFSSLIWDTANLVFLLNPLIIVVKLIQIIDDEDSMTGWDHTKNWPLKRATVLLFLPSLLEIQTFHQLLRFSWSKLYPSPMNSNDLDQCQLKNYDCDSITCRSEYWWSNEYIYKSKKYISKSIFLSFWVILKLLFFFQIILATIDKDLHWWTKWMILVIDVCLNKEIVIDSETNYSCLQLVWALKANCDQRWGFSWKFVSIYWIDWMMKNWSCWTVFT